MTNQMKIVHCNCMSNFCGRPWKRSQPALLSSNEHRLLSQDFDVARNKIQSSQSSNHLRERELGARDR